METAVGLSWQEITENLSTVVDTKDGLVMLISIEEPNITVIYLINLPLIWIDLKKKPTSNKWFLFASFTDYKNCYLNVIL